MSLPDKSDRTSTVRATSSGAPQHLGHYQIVRLIARSNDIVYEALDPAMNRHIALKELMLPPHLSAGQRRERIERFYREAKAAGNLKHQNIVTIFEVGKDGDRHFIAMEFIEGPSLRSMLQMQGALSLRDALQIGIQLCDALGYAHSRGVIHRDVKPDNIHIIAPNNAVKLTDFGIARMITEPSITTTGQVFGTPSYMSPEQIVCRTVDHRTDIFSLGVVLYEMIVGRKPFQGDSVVTITYHIMNTVPAIPPSIPPAVANIFNRALAKDSGQRYQNMAALAADLQGALAFHDSPYQQTSGAGAASVPGSTHSDNQPQAIPGFNEPTLLVGQQPGSAPPPMYSPPSAASRLAGSPGQGQSWQQPGPAAPILQRNVPEPPILRHQQEQACQPKAALALIATLLGIAIIVGILAWLVSTAYQRSMYQSDRNIAAKYYEQGVLAQETGNTSAAILDYSEAQRKAPRGSDVAVRAQQALSALTAQQGGSVEQGTDQSLDTQTGSVSPSESSPSNTPSGSSTPAPATSAQTEQQAAQTLYDQASSDQQQNKEEQALSEYAQAAQGDPTSDVGTRARQAATSGYLQLGNSDYEAGNIAKARQDWQQVIAVDPASNAATEARQQLDQAGSVTTPPPSQPAPSSNSGSGE